MLQYFMKTFYRNVARHKKLCLILSVSVIITSLASNMHIQNNTKFRKTRRIKSKRLTEYEGFLRPMQDVVIDTDNPIVSSDKHMGIPLDQNHHHTFQLHEFLAKDPLSETNQTHIANSHFHARRTPVEDADPAKHGQSPIKQWIPSSDQKALLGHKADHPLDFDGEDVLVFLHIQKTSGKTFNAHLVQDMKVPKRLECTCITMEKPHGCKCLNEAGHIWLFSRLTTAWPCGVHPSWTDLSPECLTQGMDRKERVTRARRFTVVTMLRSPYTRYISEWHQVKEDGQWTPFHKLHCYPLTKDNSCYPDDWRGVTLEQFLDCPSNPANNRQVRMLANLTAAGNCSQVFDWLRVPNTTPTTNNTSIRGMDSSEDEAAAESRYQHIVNNPLLLSAIRNLKSMPFFGLEEHQRESEYLFTRTFGFTFRGHFRQSRTFSERVTISREARERILDLNRLDLVFYRYARELFFKRLHKSIKRKHLFFVDDIGLATEEPPVS